jgi:hypothetical protein
MKISMDRVGIRSKDKADILLQFVADNLGQLLHNFHDDGYDIEKNSVADFMMWAQQEMLESNKEM